MANNNIYKNAAVAGFLQGALAGRSPRSNTQADYANLADAAQAFATAVNLAIPFDALVTTGAADPTQLDGTTATIQADTQWRAACLQSICAGVISGRYPKSETSSDYTDEAAIVAAAFAEAVTVLTTP